MEPTNQPAGRNPWIALLLTWIAPGLGHHYLGHKPKAILFFVLVTFLYAFGMVLSHFLNVSPERHWIYYLAEIPYGGATLLATLLTRSLKMVAFNPWHDVGLLYTSVAGLLNIIVMVDIYETVHPKEAPAHE
ncbi:MAG: DUF6677 family protein [Planctomycetota bacterium]